MRLVYDTLSKFNGITDAVHGLEEALEAARHVFRVQQLGRHRTAQTPRAVFKKNRTSLGTESLSRERRILRISETPEHSRELALARLAVNRFGDAAPEKGEILSFKSLKSEFSCAFQISFLFFYFFLAEDPDAVRLASRPRTRTRGTRAL